MSATIDNSPKDKQKQDLARTLSLWLLFISFLFLIGAAYMTLGKISQCSEIYKIELKVGTDSLGHLSQETKVLTDSLAYLVEHQSEIIRQKYDSILQQQDDRETFLTFAGIVVSIILSVFGFFGYTSYKSIEDAAIANAEGMAKKKLDEEMKAELERLKDKLESCIVEKYEDLKNNKLKDAIERAMSETYSDTISAKLSAIGNIEMEFDSLKQLVDRHDIMYRELMDDVGEVQKNSEENTSTSIIKERKEGEA